MSVGAAVSGTYAISVNGTLTTNGPVLVTRNNIARTAGGVYLRTPAAIPYCSYTHNTFVDLPKTSPVFYADEASGATPAAVDISDNTIINNDLTRTTAPLQLTTCTNATIRRNRIVRGGNQSIALTTCGGSYIEDNIIVEPNPANTASVGCINVTDSTAVNYYVRRNRVVTGASGYPKAVYNGSNATPTIYMDGNTADHVSVAVTMSSTPTVAASGATPFAQYGKARHFYGTAAPVSGGVYTQGDIVWNTAPSASNPPGWMCTSGGSPGTWKAMANLAA